MKHFPLTVVDDFFKNPDYIREFALKQEYFPSGGGKFPGERTRELRHLDEDLRQKIIQKIFSTFFRSYSSDQCQMDVWMYFQKILPYDPLVRNSILNSGWIHSDHGYDLGGLIYLNPFSYPEAGTSFHRKKKEFDSNPKHRFDWYKTHENEHEYLKHLKNNHDAHDEVVTVGNVYNRLVLYEGQNIPHKENSFWVNDHEPRLTLIFFSENLKFNTSPIYRTREFDL